MGRTERVKAITALEQAREGSRVISYVTSTRQGAEAQMAMDVIAPLYRHLQTIDKRLPLIDLFIHSNGGDGIVPWRLVTLLREYCELLGGASAQPSI